MHPPVRTAIIPAAGMGTRLLPLTRAVPKELLPVWKRPVLDYAVEEAVQAGIERLVVVIAPGKDALRRNFAAGGYPQLEVAFVEQRQAAGLGDAVRRAAPRGEPVAVLLPDEVLVGGNCLRQLLACRARVGGSAVAVQKVPRADVGRYGIVDVAAPFGPELSIKGMVEKPHPDSAPSDLAIIGRYVLDRAVIDALQHARPTVKGEVQLTVRSLCNYYDIEPWACQPRRPKQKNRVEAGVGLVEQEHLGAMEQRPRERQALLHAARVHAHRILSSPRQSDAVEQRIEVHVAALARKARLKARDATVAALFL